MLPRAVFRNVLLALAKNLVAHGDVAKVAKLSALICKWRKRRS